jgi:hypothetical protein
MNERIRELMDQAGELAYEEHKAKCLKNGLDPMMPFGNNLMAIMEKFAELIVQECMNAVCDPSTTYLESMTDASAMYTARERIRKHFRS